VIGIEEVKINEDYIHILIHFLMNSTTLNLQYYQKKYVEKRCLLVLGKTEAIFKSQSCLKLINLLNRIYMRIN